MKKPSYWKNMVTLLTPIDLAYLMGAAALFGAAVAIILFIPLSK